MKHITLSLFVSGLIGLTNNLFWLEPRNPGDEELTKLALQLYVSESNSYNERYTNITASLVAKSIVNYEPISLLFFYT